MDQMQMPTEQPPSPRQMSENEGTESTFQAYHYDPTPPGKPSRMPLIIIGVSIAFMVGGFVFFRGDPESAEAQNTKPDFATMSAKELAIDASAPAARELARRLAEGTGAEQAAASAALRDHPSPRLTRNFALAMAIQAKKKHYEMMLRMERERKEAMGSDYGRTFRGR